MNRADYLDAVAAELRGLTDYEKAAVRRELEGHIEDHAEALRALGCPEDEAESRAAERMGDPVETGRGIAALYRPFWLWVERIAGVLIAVMAIFCILGLPLIGSVADSIRARFENRTAFNEYMEIGDDIVRLYDVNRYQDETGSGVQLWCYAYDRSIFGIVQSSVLDRLTFEADGAQGKHDLRFPKAGGGGDFRALQYHWWLPLEDGDTRITLRYDRFGTAAELTIDLTEVLP